ncbi:MAG: homocysteine S-methyltransferase family protein [Chloroflexi bacterium]|nr:homocysteine S-methyltransferase family protein [Chloroflexota bacterium]
MSYSFVARRLKAGGVILLDGGFGTEAARRGVEGIHDAAAWSVTALNSPEIAIGIHRDFLASGADVITTGTFRTNRSALRKIALEQLARPLTIFGLSLAQEAQLELRESNNRQTCVAGSITTVGDTYSNTSLGRGSESEHREKCDWLSTGGVDLIFVETMPSLDEAICAVECAVERGKPAWLSVVLVPVSGGKPTMVDGTTIPDLIHSLSSMSAPPEAVLFNCCQPELIGTALKEGRETLAGLGNLIHMGAYPNIEEPRDDPGEPWVRRADITPQVFAQMTEYWIDAGARIVGGCCGTGPDDIRAVKKMLNERKRGAKPHRRS